MKATVFISILLLSFGIYAQSDTLNQKDSLGKKQGYWIIYGKDEPNRGFPVEGKIEEGTYKDDRKHGKWKYYYKDGESAKIIGSFKHGRPDGFFEKYYRNGRIKEQGTFNKMRYADTLKRYNEEGVIIYEGVYNKEGKEHGIVRYFHDNGKPNLVKTFNNGVSIDTTKRFSFNGDLIELVVYDSRGVKIKSFSKPQVIRDSTGKEIYRIVEPPASEKSHYEDANNSTTNDTLRSSNIFSEEEKKSWSKCPGQNGEPWMEGEYKNGRLWNGRVYIYDEDGLLLKVDVYKNGELVSDIPADTFMKRQDGCIKKFGPNGEMNATGEFKNGCLWNGRHFIFDKDGLLLKVEVYKNGKYHSDGQL